MTSITNYSKYNKGMKKSLLDKIFFMDKIDSTIIVDYGCADGTLIHFLHSLFPELQYIGFDIDGRMLSEARKKFYIEDNVMFFSRWEDVESAINSQKSTLILSSVIHEIYAYGTRTDVDIFWNRVFGIDWEYIVIRDMMPSITIDKRSDINDIRAIMQKANRGHLYDFERVWGSIENNKNLYHFLLKYRYTENWEREVQENYFPMTREELLTKIPESYKITYHDHFILPFLKKIVNKDFGIELKDSTHLKLIMEKTW